MKKNFTRKARRGAIGAIGAGTMGLLALGASAATGDPSKALSYTAAAGAAGYSFSNYYGDKLARGAGTAKKSARTAYWGSDLKKIEQAKFDKEFIKSPELMDSLTKSLGSRSAAKAAIKNGSIQAFLNNNITDKSKIGKAMKLQKQYKEAGMSDDQALQRSIAMAKWSRDANPGIFNTMSTEQQAFKNNLYNKLTQQGYDEEKARAKVDEILSDLESFET